MKACAKAPVLRFFFHIVILLVACQLSVVTGLHGQQPQTSTAPIYSVNAKYLQGVGTGFWPTPGGGLTLNVTPGTAFCNGQPKDYTAGALTMTANQTNYVYLDSGIEAPPSSYTKTTGGSLAGIYRFQLTYVTLNGETAGSEEQTTCFGAGCSPPNSDNALVVTGPAGIDTATGYRIYVTAAGGAGGTETLQGGTHSLGVNTLITSVSAGAALPSANTTRCTLSATTGGLPAGAVPLAKVVTSSSAITAITDLRSWFQQVDAALSVSVKHFGAKGNGVTDDTAAIQAAVNSGAGRVLFPPGDYKVTSTITIPRAVTLEGVGASPGGYRHSTVAVLSHWFNGTLLDFNGSAGFFTGYGGGVRRLTLRQMYGDGTAANGAGTAIHITGTAPHAAAYWVRIDDINIEDWANELDVHDQWTWGIYMDGSVIGAPSGIRDIWIQDSRLAVNTPTGGGIGIVTGYNIFISNLEIDFGQLLVTGSPGNLSSAIQIANTTGAKLAIDYAQGVDVSGGSWEEVTTTSNSSGNTIITNAITNTPTLNGSASLIQYHDGTLNRQTTLLSSGTDYTILGGRVGIGAPDPNGLLNTSANASHAVLMDSFGTEAFATLAFEAARGTRTSPSPSNMGDTVGNLEFRGKPSSAAFSPGASIYSSAANVGASFIYGTLHLATRDLNTTALTDRVVIDAAGSFGVNATPTDGAVTIAASGTNRNITLTPSGTGSVYAGGRKALQDNFFGFGSSWRALQVGQAGPNEGVAIGVNVNTNSSGNFNGNEIVLPQGRGVIMPVAANNDYRGILGLDSSNVLQIGATSFNVLGGGIFRADLVNGSASVVAQGTNQNITLTPSGTGGVIARNFASSVNNVSFSTTPTFDASLGNTQKITLTDNATSSTLSNATAGESLTFVICQDATGGRTFVWPSNIMGGMTVGSTASKCSAQSFIFDGTKAYALSGGASNL